jgi:hypothetical protein
MLRLPTHNGKGLSGWKTAGGKAKFYVENDEIIGESVSNTPNFFFITEKITAMSNLFLQLIRFFSLTFVFFVVILINLF